MTRSRDVSAVQNNLGVAIPPMAAGKNAVINGGMDIWQRGTSISLAASTAYTSGFGPDRWQTNTGANQATTLSRQLTNDTTNLPNIQYCLRFQRNSGQTGTSLYALVQNFETVNSIPFAGKTVTLSFYARAGANYSASSSILSAQVISGTGTDQNAFAGYTGGATVINQNPTLTTTWQRFSYSGTVGATATELDVQFNFTPTGTAGANDYYEITGVQLELGSSATPFSRAGGNIQGELAACQRYYWRNVSGSAYGLFGIGKVDNGSTTAATIPVNLPVTMRTNPASIDYSNLRVTDATTFGSAITSLTITAGNQTPNFVVLNAGVASGLTGDRPVFIGANNSSTAYLGVSAEL